MRVVFVPSYFDWVCFSNGLFLCRVDFARTSNSQGVLTRVMKYRVICLLPYRSRAILICAPKCLVLYFDGGHYVLASVWILSSGFLDQPIYSYKRL